MTFPKQIWSTVLSITHKHRFVSILFLLLLVFIVIFAFTNPFLLLNESSWKEEWELAQETVTQIDPDAVYFEGKVTFDGDPFSGTYDYTLKYLRSSGDIISIQYIGGQFASTVEVEVDQEGILPAPKQAFRDFAEHAAQTIRLSPETIYQRAQPRLASFSAQHGKPCRASMLWVQGAEIQQQYNIPGVWSILCSSYPNLLILRIDPATGVIIEEISP